MILFSQLKSWTLKQTESWGESKTHFKGEVYGLKRGGEGEEKHFLCPLHPSPFPTPPPLVFFFVVVKMAATINVPLSFH